MRHPDIIAQHLEKKIDQVLKDNEKAYENCQMFSRLYEQWKDETNRTAREVTTLQSELEEVKAYMKAKNEAHQITLFDILNK